MSVSFLPHTHTSLLFACEGKEKKGTNGYDYNKNGNDDNEKQTSQSPLQ